MGARWTAAEELSLNHSEALLLAALDYMPELASARVEFGFVYCGLERYGEMAGEFREAIRIDTRAVRAAVQEEPKELEELWRILHPPPEARAPQEQHHRPMPRRIYARARRWWSAGGKR
jgi:hypothetical protein